jgi:hypothetical protein
MGDRTGGFYGINEALLASAMAAVVFALASAQPLTVVGITGLISLFNYTIYDIVNLYEPSIFPQFMVWVSIWSGIFHWIVAVFNLCDYMRYVTDFSSESFGYYVSIIYLIKGVELLTVEFSEHGSEDGFMSTLIAIFFFGTVYYLEKLGACKMFKPWVRSILGDYAYPIATIFWTGFSHIPGTLKRVNVTTLDHTRAFYPTVDRPWVVDFWNLSVKWVFVAMPFGFLIMLLFYYDHNVSSITAQAKQFPLKKPGGFHWDFFLLGATCFGAGVLNVPLPNGLVPQAPVHTDALTVYETKLNMSKTTDGAEIREPEVVAVEVKEQRISHLLMALAIIGTMTGPLLVVLHTIPRGLFGGVFFVVGYGGLEGSGITNKILYLMRESRFNAATQPLRQISHKKIVHYLAWQALGIATTVAISQTIAAIGFPVLIIALIPLRWMVLPRWFTIQELKILDAPTADSDIVLASLGGKPAWRGADGEVDEKSDEDARDVSNTGSTGDVERSAVRQRVGAYDRE